MDHSLSRGYATQLIQSLPENPDPLKVEWMGKTHTLLCSKRSKGQGQKALASFKRGQHAQDGFFYRTDADNVRHATGFLLTRADGHALISRDLEISLTGEEAILLSRAEIFGRDHKYGLPPQGLGSKTLSSNVSMSKHTLTRLLQRNGTQPDTLRKHCAQNMRLVEALGFHAQYVAKAIHAKKGATFFVPFSTGAFVVSATRVFMEGHDNREHGMPHFAIRTFLDEKMLSQDVLNKIQTLKNFLADHKPNHIARFISQIEEPAFECGTQDDWKELMSHILVHEEFRLQSQRHSNQTP